MRKYKLTRNAFGEVESIEDSKDVFDLSYQEVVENLLMQQSIDAVMDKTNKSEFATLLNRLV